MFISLQVIIFSINVSKCLWSEKIFVSFLGLNGLCHELRGYSVITHLTLKIRLSVKKTLLIKHVNIYRVLVAFQLLVPHLD